MANDKKKTVEDLEAAINVYLNNGDLSIFNEFIGTSDGFDPYGEPELGKEINAGRLDNVATMIAKMSTFSVLEDLFGKKLKHTGDAIFDGTVVAIKQLNIDKFIRLLEKMIDYMKKNHTKTVPFVKGVGIPENSWRAINSGIVNYGIH